jgi:hypothetical protein
VDWLLAPAMDNWCYVRRNPRLIGTLMSRIFSGRS